MSSTGKGEPPKSGKISDRDRAAFKERSSELGKKLDQARSDQTANSPQPPSDAKARNVESMGRALRMSTEMIGGIVVGSAIGWGLDTWLGTWPWLFILFFLLGSAAGMLNVVRAGMKMKTGPLDPSKGPQVIDDDDT